MYEEVKKFKDMTRMAFAKSRLKVFSKDQAYGLVEKAWTKYLEDLVKGGDYLGRRKQANPTEHRG